MATVEPAGGPGQLSANALERRVKRWLLEGPFDCYVQVTPGLEETLVDELVSGGFATSRDELRVGHGGVGVALDHVGIMRANLSLRSASRVLLRLGAFPAATPEMLYDRARQVPWVTQLGYLQQYAVTVTSRNSRLQAGDAVAATLASAVSRELRPLGLYPKRTHEAALRFHVRLQDDRCTVSLDTSGEHLHRRGVRRHVHTAPVRETLAAAMALAGLERLGGVPDVLVDPFCGSGTLLLEAHDLLAGLPPGRHREFAFQHAAWFRPGAWREVKRRGAAEATPLRTRLLGIDVESGALAAAAANLAGPEYAAVELLQADSTGFDFAALGARRGLVLANLPYGVRLSSRREALAVAEAFLANLAGSGAWWVVLLTTSAPDLLPHLQEARATPTRNGGLAVTLVSGRSVR